MRLIFLSVLLLMTKITFAEPILSIAVAANFEGTLQKLITTFQHEPHQSSVNIVISSASTGELCAQIIHGAPYDLALLADKEHLVLLEKNGTTIPHTQWIYAIGKLVMWNPTTDHRLTRQDLIALTYSTSSKIALANPDFSPYGLAAKQTLQALHLWQKLYPQFVFGNSVSQATNFVATRNAKLGFIAYSEVLHDPYLWIIPASLYSPLKQYAVLLQHAKNHPDAWRFKAFMQSAKAKEIIRKDGYGI